MADRVVTLRMTEAEYALLVGLSKSNHRSMNGQLLALVTSACSHDDSTPPADPVPAPRQHDDSTVLAPRQQDAGGTLSTRAGAALDLDLSLQGQTQDQLLPPVDPPKPSKRRKPGVPLPDDWRPSAAHAVLASSLAVDLDLEAAKFRDYADGNDWRKVDWEATFRNWLREAAMRLSRSNGARASPNGRRPDHYRPTEADYLDGAIP